MENESAHRNYFNESTQQDVSFSDEISTTTLVKLLVRKGLLTTQEVLEEERLTRLQKHIIEAKIENHLAHKHKEHSRFKKWASKRRWSRRVTATLFGWEWKKSKHTHEADSD